MDRLLEIVSESIRAKFARGGSDERYPLGGIKDGYPSEGMEPKGEDLGFGFNEEGYPLQDKYEFQGFPIAVENRKGSTRKWYDPDGKEKGSTKMHADYGYVEGAMGSDGEPVDVYIGPDEKAEFAYVVHQNKAPDFVEYDEDKVMLGFSSEEDARKAYLKQYDDEGFYGGMSSMPLEKFREKVQGGGKITNESVLHEAGAPKTISHLEDLKPHEFMAWLEKYKDLPLKGGLEVSEKVDGSARISFGVQGGKLWTQSKYGTKKTAAEQYPDQPMYRPLRMAHKALESAPINLISQFPEDLVFVAEILYTRIPNSIEYGENRVIVHGVYKDGKQLGDAEAQAAATAVIEKTAGLTDGTDEWKFEYKRVIPPEEVMVDTRKEYHSISEIYAELKRLEPDKLKAAGKGPYKAVLAKFQAIQLALKEKLVGQLRKQKSAYGPEGGDVEGLVFRDLESGLMTKLVDKDYFTKLNKFLWHYRELLDKGVKDGETWRPGVMQQLRNRLADEVLGHPLAKTPGFVTKLQEFGRGLEYPVEADTPEKRTDFLLAQYVKKNKLAQGDFLAQTAEILDQIGEVFQEVRKEWDSKKGKLSFKGKGKTVKMDPLIQGRTEEAFSAMEQHLAGFRKALEAIGGMRGELTKRTALLKLSLGQSRLEKLQTQPEGEVNEDDTVKQGGAPSDVFPVWGTMIQNKFGKVGRELGSGWHGSVYELPGNKVLKVTDDDDEAKTANHLKGKKLKHIVNVSQVFRLPAKGFDWFGIVQERLQEIPEDPMLKAAITFFTKRAWTVGRQVFTAWEIPWQELKTAVGKSCEGDPEEEQEFKDAVATFEKYQIPQIMDELQKHKVQYSDLHTGNIMKRGGNVVLTDLGGNSRSPGAMPAPLKEAAPSMRPTPRPEHIEEPEAKEFLVRYKAKLAARGIKVPDLPKTLGVGTRGVAFDLGSGRVLKVTGDRSEALVAVKIQGKNMKYVVDVYDAFQFEKTGVYGIYQEKLEPLPGASTVMAAATGESRELNDALGTFSMNNLLPEDYKSWKEFKMAAIKRLAIRKTEMGAEKGAKLTRDMSDALRTFEKYNIDKMMDELAAHGIFTGDYHAGNIMKKGDRYVLIDLGNSDVKGAKEPDVLEARTASGQEGLGTGMLDNMIREIIQEAKADTIGVTIGRFQPFHKGHAEIIRRLASRFTKVLVIVAGNRQDKRNPFSWDLRLEMMEKSLPDVLNKVEFHKAEMGGKGSGYIPGVLSDISLNKKSSISGDSAFTIMVGQDRVEEIKKQIEHARLAKEQGTEMFFDPNLAIVETLPGVKNDDDTERVSGSKLRDAVAAGDMELAKKMLDSHLVSNDADFKSIFERMQAELGALQKTKLARPIERKVVETVIENMASAGGPAALTNVLQDNSAALQKEKGINVAQLKLLGNGQDGLAYDLGGKVLKITTDRDEALASQKIKGKKFQHIVNVHDVFRFKEVEAAKIDTIYGIILEKLTKMSDGEETEFDKLSRYMLDKRVIDSLGDHDPKKVRSMIAKAVKDDTYKSFGLESKTEAAPTTAPQTTIPQRKSFDPGVHAQKKMQTAELETTKRTAELFNLMKKYQVDQILQDLRNANIKYYDLHYGNLMKRGSNFVVTDLGRSQSGGAEPPTLGETLDQVISEVLGESGIPADGVTPGGPGSSQVGLRANTSPWSAPRGQMSDDPEKAEWQNNLRGLVLPQKPKS